MESIKPGDILWRMVCRRLPGEGETWAAVPICVEHVDERKFLDAWHCGGSLNSIGKNYFLTREEALADHEKHKGDRTPVSTEGLRTRPQIGSIAPDSVRFIWEEDRILIFRGAQSISLDDLKWKQIDGDFGPDFCITLGEIRDELGDGIMTVVHEDYLNGVIYQTGNYHAEKAWRIHGLTHGYA